MLKTGQKFGKKSNNAKYAKIPCEGCNDNGELNDTTFESMPDSVKSMITVDNFDASGYKKLWDCMDDKNEKSATHVVAAQLARPLLAGHTLPATGPLLSILD